MKIKTFFLPVAFALIIFTRCNTPEKQQQQNQPVNGQSADSSKSTLLDVNYLAPPDTEYTGDFFKRYANGLVEVRGFFRFGKKHGKWMYFFPNGHLWSEAFFENDKINGESKVYHQNGKLYYEGQYIQGIPAGTWRFYDSTGTLAQTRKYDSIPVPEKK